MNEVKISGRLVFDAELKTTYSGKSVINIILSVGRDDHTGLTDYVDCIAWQEVAVAIAEIGQKGTPIELYGRIVNDAYTDRSGMLRKVQKVWVSGFTLLEDSK